MLLNRSRGELGGKPFAQHCSCPAVLRCSVGLTVAAFWELFSYGKNIASVAQAPLVPALHQQGGNVRVAPIFRINIFRENMNVPPSAASLQALWSHLLVLPTRLPLSKSLTAPEADLPKVMAASRP